MAEGFCSISAPYLIGVSAVPDRMAQGNGYPFTLPFVRQLDLRFESPVTFFVGENGTGKSTLIEAIASLCRLPVSGGGRNELTGRHGPDAVSPLAPALRSAFRRRPPDAYFLRAEFQAHFASLLDARRDDPDFPGYWTHLRAIDDHPSVEQPTSRAQRRGKQTRRPRAAR